MQVVDPLFFCDDNIAVDSRYRQRDDVDEVVAFPRLLPLYVLGPPEDIGDVSGRKVIDELDQSSLAEGEKLIWLDSCT